MKKISLSNATFVMLVFTKGLFELTNCYVFNYYRVFLERIINEKDSVQYIKQITVYLNGLTKDKLIIVNFLDFTTYKNTYVENYICTKC